jgi:hypothetical protein
VQVRVTPAYWDPQMPHLPAGASYQIINWQGCRQPPAKPGIRFPSWLINVRFSVFPALTRVVVGHSERLVLQPMSIINRTYVQACKCMPEVSNPAFPFVPNINETIDFEVKRKLC